MLIVRDDQYGFLGSDSEPTSGRSSRKWKKGQAFPLAISYRGFFPSDASTLVLADEPMPMMPASSSQAVGSQTTLPQVNPPIVFLQWLGSLSDPCPEIVNWFFQFIDHCRCYLHLLFSNCLITDKPNVVHFVLDFIP